MIKKLKHSSVYLGDKTKRLVDNYAKEHDISRSATIKIAVNEFFMNKGRKR